MFAIITDDRTGEELARYTLGENDQLSPEHHAQVWANSMGVSLAEKSGHVPLGCGDFTATVQDVPGSVVCWASESFFIEG